MSPRNKPRTTDNERDAEPRLCPEEGAPTPWLPFKHSGGALESHSVTTGRVINEVTNEVPLSSLGGS